MTEQQERQIERFVQAAERMADSFERLYDVMQQRFAREYPPPKERNESTVTHLQTDDERLRQDQGQTEEPIEEWVGLREEKFRRQAKGEEGGEPKK